MVALASTASIATSASPAWSQEWTCVSESNNNFTTVWRVKSLPEVSVYHVSSYIPGREKIFNVNENLNIIGKQNEFIFAYKESTNAMNFFVFNTARKTYTSSGHFLDAERTPAALFFVCK